MRVCVLDFVYFGSMRVCMQIFVHLDSKGDSRRGRLYESPSAVNIGCRFTARMQVYAGKVARD